MIREEQQNCLRPFGNSDLKTSGLSVRILQAHVYDVVPCAVNCEE